MRGRRRFHPGERPRAARPEARPARQDQRRGAARRADRFVHLGPAAQRVLRRGEPPRALPGRPPVQPGLPAAAGGGGRRRTHRCRGRAGGDAGLRVAGHASAARTQGSTRLHRRPPARGALARGAAPGQRRRGHDRRDRRCDPLRRRPALVVHGHLPDLHPGWRQRRHAPLHGAVRPGAAIALDLPAGAGTHRSPDRPGGGGYRRAAGRTQHRRARTLPRRLPVGGARGDQETKARHGFAFAE